MGKNNRRKVAAYAMAGGASTLVNYIVFGALLHMGAGAVAANMAAWLAASLFSFAACKRYVFRRDGKGDFRELAAFLAARGASCIAETLAVWLFVSALGFPWLPVKLGGSALSLILNYMACDLLIFRDGGAKISHVKK